LVDGVFVLALVVRLFKFILFGLFMGFWFYA